MAVRIGLIVEPTGDHLSHYFRSGRCEGVAAVAVADGSGTLASAAAKAAGREVAAFPNAVSMMREFQPQLAIVSMEPHRMPGAISIALDGGAHVVAEKPACVDLASFQRCAEIAGRRKRQLMLAMATRLDPAAIEARRIIERGWLGSRIYGAQMHWVADQTRLKNPAYHRSWKSSKALGGGGKLIFHGIHYIDLLHYLTGDRVERVSGFTANVGGQPIEVEDAAAISMRLRRGGLATLNTGYYLDRGYSNLIALWGSAGWLRFEPRKDPPLTWLSNAAGAPAGVQQYRLSGKHDMYELMLQASVDFASGSVPPFIQTDESADALSVVFAGYEAVAHGAERRVR